MTALLVLARRIGWKLCKAEEEIDSVRSNPPLEHIEIEAPWRIPSLTSASR